MNAKNIDVGLCEEFVSKIDRAIAGGNNDTLNEYCAKLKELVDILDKDGNPTCKKYVDYLKNQCGGLR